MTTGSNLAAKIYYLAGTKNSYIDFQFPFVNLLLEICEIFNFV
jgi:hypothetical protein